MKMRDGITNLNVGVFGENLENLFFIILQQNVKVILHVVNLNYQWIAQILFLHRQWGNDESKVKKGCGMGGIQCV